MDKLNCSIDRLEASLIRVSAAMKDLRVAQRRTLAVAWIMGVGVIIALNGAIVVGILNLVAYLNK